MLGRRAEESKEPPKPPKPPVEWTVRYYTLLDSGLIATWEWVCDWEPKDGDRNRVAGDMLLATKHAERALHHDGVVYPPHRIKQVTWKIL